MRISISTFLYFNYALEDSIKKISESGYRGIEIWGGRPHAYPNDLTNEEIFSLRKLIDKSNLEISAFIPAQFRYPTSICSPNDRIRTDSLGYLKDSINTSLKFGCNKVSICPGHTLYGQGYQNGIEKLSSSIRELHKFASQKGVILFIEPAHRFESDLILTVKDGVDFISKLGLNNLGIALDTGHCNVNGESLVESVSVLKGLPYHIHIDDNHGKSDEHIIPGEGIIDFIPFLRELKKDNYQGFLTVELGWNYTLEPDSPALKSRQMVNKLLHNI